MGSERGPGLPVETQDGQLRGEQAAGLALVHALGGLYLAVVTGSAHFAACKLLTRCLPSPKPPQAPSLVAGETAWKCRPIASGKRAQAQAPAARSSVPGAELRHRAECPPPPVHKSPLDFVWRNLFCDWKLLATSCHQTHSFTHIGSEMYTHTWRCPDVSARGHAFPT